MDKLLKGLAFGTPQTSGMMTIIPLIGEDVKEEMGSIKDTKFNSTYSYGSMVFQNTSDKPVILPSGYTVITKQSAQDHGLPFAAVIEPERTKQFDCACCVEQTQPGMINGNGVVDFNLLPLMIRKDHFKKFVLNERPDSVRMDFGRLWDSISQFQSELVGKNEAHISYFFTKFVDELNKFNAEFEIVPKQRGAVILINEEMVGLEIVPTHDDWTIIWKKLIRDCYGSEVVRLTKLNLVKTFKENQKQKLDITHCQSIEEIEEAIENHTDHYLHEIEGRIKNVFSKEKKRHTHYQALRLEGNKTDRIQYSLESSNGGKNMFEIFQTDDEVLYCSMITG